MKCILIDPEFDDPTHYSHLWAQRLKRQIEAKGWQVAEVGGRRVSRVEVEHALAENPEVPYIHMDHGSEDAHWGSEVEPVLDLANVDKVAGRIVYCMNCLSARKLGAVAYTNYSCIYVGYIEEFAFTTENEQYFCEAANSGFIAYANGESNWTRIKQIMIETFNKIVDAIADPWGKMWARWDRDSLRIWCKGVDEPKPTCPISRMILFLFGWKALIWLRRVRDKVKYSLIVF
jgi:hypothetical protein